MLSFSSRLKSVQIHIEDPVVVSLEGYSEISIKGTVLLNLLFGIVHKISIKQTGVAKAVQDWVCNL